MSKRIVSLILSLIYCGFGQIYNGQVMKGIDFIIIYTLLIVALFSSSALLHLLGFTILPFMWFVGMADAYLYKDKYEEVPLQRKTWVLVILSGVAISLVSLSIQVLLGLGKSSTPDAQITAVPPENGYVAQKDDAGADQEIHQDEGNIAITAYSLKPTTARPGTPLAVEYTIHTTRAMDLGLGFSIQKVGTDIWLNDPSNDKVLNIGPGSSDFSREFVLPYILTSGVYNVRWGVWDSHFTVAYDSKQSDNALNIVTTLPTEDQSDISEFFSIQVAAVKDLKRAKGLCDELLQKEYQARIQNPASPEEKWYRVLIGKFRTKRDALQVARELRKREGLSYMIVHRRADEETSSLQTQP